MFDLIASILDVFYDWTGSYGISIIMLTLVAMIVVLPFTLKGTRSMIEMQRMQPELKKIQTKYKDDRQKQNEEVMKFYQENNINPVGGCLPMFIQLPVFLVLFQILRGLTRRASSIGELAGQGAALVGQVLPDLEGKTRAFNPAYLSDGSQLRADLADSTEMNFIGLDLAPSTSEMVSRGLSSAFPYIILILVVFATGWIQHKQIQGRATGAAANPQQQTIMKIMPFILPIVSFGLPAAMLLYFIVSNGFRIAQQAYITKNIYGN
jgi:YidC/Oxa1 family membrane protein insertase